MALVGISCSRMSHWPRYGSVGGGGGDVEQQKVSNGIRRRQVTWIIYWSTIDLLTK